MAGMAAPVVAPAGVWQAWNYVYTVYGNGGTMGTTVTGTADPWPYWNAGYSASTTSATTLTLTTPQWQSWNSRYEETAEQQAARVAAQERYRAEQAERARQNEIIQAQERARRAAVNTRAEELLFSLLTDEQARSYTEHGWFEVRGSKGGRWRIRNQGQAGNVDLMPEIGSEPRSDPDRDIRVASFCCHPPGGLPDADAHLAQMLHLVTDEDGFRRTANITYRRPHVPVGLDVVQVA